jgi:WD40 repeat protein
MHTAETAYPISYKSLVTSIGYPAAHYLYTKWEEKKIIESENIKTSHVINNNNTIFDIINRIKSTLPDIQNNIGNLVVRPYIHIVHDSIYKLSEAKNIPCAFYGFADSFDKNNNPIIISEIDDTIVFYDTANENYFDIPVQLILPPPCSIVCNNDNFLCTRYGEFVYFFNKTCTVNMPMSTKTTVVGLSDTMFALGTDSGQILFNSIDSLANVAITCKVIPARHLSCVSALALHDHNICSGDTNGIVKLWDCRTCKRSRCISTHKKRMCGVTSLLLDNQYIRVGCNNGVLLTYDQRQSFTPLYQIPGYIHNNNDIISLAQNEGILYSATKNKILHWEPSFMVEKTLENLSFDEKMYIYMAMQ